MIQLAPSAALRSILELLPAKNLEQVSQDDNQVPIITVHQSKGWSLIAFHYRCY